MICWDRCNCVRSPLQLQAATQLMSTRRSVLGLVARRSERWSTGKREREEASIANGEQKKGGGELYHQLDEKGRSLRDHPEPTTRPTLSSVVTSISVSPLASLHVVYPQSSDTCEIHVSGTVECRICMQAWHVPRGTQQVSARLNLAYIFPNVWVHGYNPDPTDVEAAEVCHR